MYIYIYKTISEIRGHEFGEEWGVVYGKVWRKEGEGGSVGIILKFFKN